MKSNVSKYYTITVIVSSLIFVTAIILRIVQIQYVEGDRWLKLAEKIEKRKYKIEAQRGNIYTHDHKLIVTSTPVYMMRFDFKTPHITQNNGAFFKKNVDSLCIELNRLFPEKSVQQFKQEMTSYYSAAQKKGSRTRTISPPITHTLRREIEQTHMFGDKNKFAIEITWDTLWVRTRPYGNIGQRLLGNTYPNDQYNSDSTEVHYRGTGKNGLENYFDTYLQGTDGMRQRMFAYGKDVSLNIVEPIPGNDIITTLDIDIQDIVESELENQLKHLNGQWGTAIVMEVKTGAVLACANLGKIANGYDEINNYAIGRVEPGSTMKTMAIMAALQDGLINMSDTVDTGKDGVYDIPNVKDGKKTRIVDWCRTSGGGFGKLTVMEALYASSNIGVAKSIIRAYGNDYEKFVKSIERLGITDPRSIELNNMPLPRVEIPKDIVTFSRMSYGYFIELPPIYTLRFYNAIANNGKMMKPYVCKAIARNGEIVEEYKPEVIKSSICSSSVLKEIQQALENVVWSDKEVMINDSRKVHIATGMKAQSKYVRIAGKTGTVQLIVNREYDATRHRISFCGYFPVENPQYSCIVVIHDPEIPGAGGSDCALVLKRIAERMVSLKQRRDINDIISTQDFQKKMPAIKTGYEGTTQKLVKKLHLKEYGIDIEKNSNKILHFQQDEEGQISYNERNIDTDNKLVPNVIGMGAKDAVYLLEKAGLQVRLQGSGKIVSQSLQPGSNVKKGTLIDIKLR